MPLVLNKFIIKDDDALDFSALYIFYSTRCYTVMLAACMLALVPARDSVIYTSDCEHYYFGALKHGCGGCGLLVYMV